MISNFRKHLVRDVNVLGALITAFRWAERERLISRNPLHGLRKPKRASRGAKAIIAADDHARLVRCASKPFRAFLQLLWLTGARPGEIAGLHAEHVDLDNRKAEVKHCFSYGYRHGFATDALARGVPDALVAEMLGHSGTAMFYRHYAHLTCKVKEMRKALGQVR